MYEYLESGRTTEAPTSAVLFYENRASSQIRSPFAPRSRQGTLSPGSGGEKSSSKLLSGGVEANQHEDEASQRK